MRRRPALPNDSINLRDLQVRRIAIERVEIDPRNARTRSDAQLAAVADSIREFNWTNPVLIRPDGVVIAGHARLLAAQRLGLTEVPVMEITGLTEAQCRALAIADNQLGLRAEWDDARLRAELAALQQQSFDLDLIGFDQKELARLLSQQAGASELADPNRVPDTSGIPVTEPVICGFWVTIACCVAMPAGRSRLRRFSLVARPTWSSPIRPISPDIKRF